MELAEPTAQACRRYPQFQTSDSCCARAPPVKIAGTRPCRLVGRCA